MSTYLSNLIARTFVPADGLRPLSTSLARSAADVSATMRGDAGFAERLEEEGARPVMSSGTRSAHGFRDVEGWRKSDTGDEARVSGGPVESGPGGEGASETGVARAESAGTFVRGAGVSRSFASGAEERNEGLATEQEQRREPDRGEHHTVGMSGGGEGARSTSFATTGGSVGGAAFKGLETPTDDVFAMDVFAMDEGGATQSRLAGERQRTGTRAAGDTHTVTKNLRQSGGFRAVERDAGAKAEGKVGEASGRNARPDTRDRAADTGVRPAVSRIDFGVFGTEVDGRSSKDAPEMGGGRAEGLEAGKPWAESRASMSRSEEGDGRRAGLSGTVMATRSRRPAQPVERQAEQAEPTVHITIGRLEVRGAAPAAAPTQRPSKPASPVASLEEYLRGRNRGQRRE